jgi:hypothetical protein
MRLASGEAADLVPDQITVDSALLAKPDELREFGGDRIASVSSCGAVRSVTAFSSGFGGGFPVRDG